MEFLLELLGELVIQIVVECLVELGIHSIAEPLRKPPNPWIAAIGYALFGAIIGGLSLLVFPHNLMPEAWRVMNIVLTPLAAGLAMMVMGRWRARRGDTRLRIDRFGYGYLFALAMALVRYQYAS
jgi:RsiW-degrading membrane proteinase PrsW (M82 family)